MRMQLNYCGLANSMKLKGITKFKKNEPEDLMPNIQYWLGEVYYAQKNFEKAIIAFGEGLENILSQLKVQITYLSLGYLFQT